MLILIGFVAFFILVGLAYVIITLMVIPGLAEERLGSLEELPEDAEQWRVDEHSPEAAEARLRNLQRETRLWIDHDMLGRERITRQFRYVDPQTGEVVGSDPDQRITRRRIKH